MASWSIPEKLRSTLWGKARGIQGGENIEDFSHLKLTPQCQNCHWAPQHPQTLMTVMDQCFVYYPRHCVNKYHASWFTMSFNTIVSPDFVYLSYILLFINSTCNAFQLKTNSYLLCSLQQSWQFNKWSFTKVSEIKRCLLWFWGL